MGYLLCHPENEGERRAESYMKSKGKAEYDRKSRKIRVGKINRRKPRMKMQRAGSLLQIEFQ